MEKESPQKKGYGKKSLKKWIVIYLVVGIVVYGLIYLVILAQDGSSPTYSY